MAELNRPDHRNQISVDVAKKKVLPFILLLLGACAAPTTVQTTEVPPSPVPLVQPTAAPTPTAGPDYYATAKSLQQDGLSLMVETQLPLHEQALNAQKNGDNATASSLYATLASNYSRLGSNAMGQALNQSLAGESPDNIATTLAHATDYSQKADTAADLSSSTAVTPTAVQQ